MNLSVIMMIQPHIETAAEILRFLGNGLVIVDLVGFVAMLGILIFELF
ncbi:MULTISPECIES: hypothetical protein [Methylosinus]|nr:MULTISPECIES: hypothetical protein [Methylosinus]